MPADPGPRGDLAPLPYRRETEAALRQASPLRFAWRNRHATIPLSVPAAFWTAGTLAHFWHHGFDLEVISGAADAIVWFRAPGKWDRPAEAWYARMSVIFAGAWLTWADVQGVHGGQEVLLLIASAAWGIPFWWHKRPRGKRKRRRHAREVARWNAWWQSHAPAWGVAGSGIADVDHKGVTDILDVRLWAGRQTVADIRRLVPLIESALAGHVHAGMTRIEQVRHNPSRVLVHLKREDPLREEITWDESLLSADICDPVPLGIRETGGWLEAVLRANWFVNGVTRSGKSNNLNVKLAKITKCRNARALMIDMKGGRAARPWLPAIDWLATTTAEADLLLLLCIAEIKARAAYADNGEDEQLAPTAEVPTLFLVIDETYEVTSAMSGAPGAARRAGWLATVASQGSGVEVYVIVVTQHGTLAESVATEETRANLRRRMCFQTEHRDHGMFTLGDDAQRSVDTTTLQQKGSFYYRQDSRTSPEQVRGPHIPRKLARQVAERNAERTALHSRPLVLYCGGQPISAEDGAPAWQQVYDQRWERLPEAFRRDAPQAAHLTPPEDERVTTKINMRPVHPGAASINEDIDAGPAASDAEIRRAKELRAARGEGPVDLAGERDRRRRFAELLQAATIDSPVTPKDLEASGLGRTWIHQHLSALADAGVVSRTAPNRAERFATGDVREAMGMISREADRLASSAREMAAR